MVTQKIAKFAVTAVAAAGLGAAAFAGAGTASAGSADTEFLRTVDQIGIVYDSPEDAFHDAHLVCERLDYGTDPDDILESYLEVSPDLTTRDGKDFILAAATAYCPEYL